MIVPFVASVVGRCKSFFLVCWPPRDTHVPYLLKTSIIGVRVFTLTLRSVSLSSLRCCPPTISSVIADHDDFCELPSYEGRRVAYSTGR
jgi:hypothetical protein